MADEMEPRADPGMPSPLGGAADLSPDDAAALAEAVRALEGTSFAANLSGLVGRQLGAAGGLLPARFKDAADKAASAALRTALRGAVRSLPTEAGAPGDRLHLAAVAATGAVGGALGLATLPIELPVSTALILRSVAAIARTSGEDLEDPESMLACVEVFALGAGDSVLGESSYFAVRALLAKSVTEAARHVAARGVADGTAPVLSRLIGQVASRFGLVVSQKLAAQAVPVIGAVTGAAVNAAFMDHYQRLARGHFTVRRLERRYGPAVVRAAYERRRAARDAERGAAEGSRPATSVGTVTAAARDPG